MKNEGTYVEKVGNITFTVKVKSANDAKLDLEQLVKKIVAEKSAYFQAV